jgi:hypothetical protein
MGRIRRHVSYANVAATLALVLAMSGGAVAATGGFSSGGTLRACANEEGAIRLLKPGKKCAKGQQQVAWNQTGPAGAKGVAGAIGATGATGAAGSAGVAGPKGATGEKGAEGTEGASGAQYVTVRTVERPASSYNAIVECEPGERATGGGAARADGVAASNDSITMSAPVNQQETLETEGTPTGWEIGASFDAPSKVFVVCVSP